MPEVTWLDDSKPIRLFQVGVRLASHFYDAMASISSVDTYRSPSHADELHQRWQVLSGDQTVAEFDQRLHKELSALAGEAVFDRIRAELEKPFQYDRRLQILNQRALEKARSCVEAWGGAKAKKRIDLWRNPFSGRYVR